MLRVMFLFAIGLFGFTSAASAQIRILDDLGGVMAERLKGSFPAWSHLQATGKPNTLATGDIPTAWASATQDADEEWLELIYEKEIAIKEIHVYETYNTGALFKITGYKKSDMEVPIWSGDDPTPVGAGKGISKIKLKTPLKTKRIRIHLRSKAVPGWNEIDAVGVIDTDAKTHWAVDASASSTYGGGTLVPDERDAQIEELKAKLEVLKAEAESLKQENAVLKAKLKQR